MGVYDDGSIQGLSILDLKRRLVSRKFGHLAHQMSKEERVIAQGEVEKEKSFVVQLICEELNIPIKDYNTSYDEGEFNNQIMKSEAIIRWYREDPPYG